VLRLSVSRGAFLAARHPTDMRRPLKHVDVVIVGIATLASIVAFLTQPNPHLACGDAPTVPRPWIILVIAVVLGFLAAGVTAVFTRPTTHAKLIWAATTALLAVLVALSAVFESNPC
jgi:hypothetical protein